MDALQGSRWETAFKSDKQDWATPWPLFHQLDHEFHFTLDVCAMADNAKCPIYFSPDQDGLVQDWGTNVCWCNPPYGPAVGEWMAKAYRASLRGATVVCLVYARTDTQWFHRWVYGKAEIRFLEGRVRFIGAPNVAPAPSLLAIFRPNQI